MVRTQQFSAEDRAAVVSVLESQAQAWNRGDLEGYMAGYERSPALLFTSGAKVRRGWEATFANYRRRYGEAPESMGQLDFDIDDVRGVGDGAAVVLGRWTLTETPQASTGVFSVVFARTPAGWRVVHDHSSAAD